jgi:hypothetical protein
MLSTMAYSIQNIINFQKKVSNSMILSIYVRSIKDWLRPKWLILAQVHPRKKDCLKRLVHNN